MFNSWYCTGQEGYGSGLKRSVVLCSSTLRTIRDRSAFPQLLFLYYYLYNLLKIFVSLMCSGVLKQGRRKHRAIQSSCKCLFYQCCTEQPLWNLRYLQAKEEH